MTKRVQFFFHVPKETPFVGHEGSKRRLIGGRVSTGIPTDRPVPHHGDLALFRRHLQAFEGREGRIAKRFAERFTIFPGTNKRRTADERHQDRSRTWMLARALLPTLSAYQRKNVCLLTVRVWRVCRNFCFALEWFDSLSNVSNLSDGMFGVMISVWN